MQLHLIHAHLWEADRRAPSLGEQHHREHKRREEEGSKTRAGFEESTQINIGNVGLKREAGRYSTWHMAWIKRLKYLCLCRLPSMFPIFVYPSCVWETAAWKHAGQSHIWSALRWSLLIYTVLLHQLFIDIHERNGWGFFCKVVHHIHLSACKIQRETVMECNGIENSQHMCVFSPMKSLKNSCCVFFH